MISPCRLTASLVLANLTIFVGSCSDSPPPAVVTKVEYRLPAPPPGDLLAPMPAPVLAGADWRAIAAILAAAVRSRDAALADWRAWQARAWGTAKQDTAAPP